MFVEYFLKSRYRHFRDLSIAITYPIRLISHPLPLGRLSHPSTSPTLEDIFCTKSLRSNTASSVIYIPLFGCRNPVVIREFSDVTVEFVNTSIEVVYCITT
jgi:hypothetical protein